MSEQDELNAPPDIMNNNNVKEQLPINNEIFPEETDGQMSPCDSNKKSNVA